MLSCRVWRSAIFWAPLASTSVVLTLKYGKGQHQVPESVSDIIDKHDKFGTSSITLWVLSQFGTLTI